MGLSEIIQELRGERALSQKQLAEAIGVSQSTIAKIETNRNEATASTVRKLANYFQVSADYLLGLEDEFGAKSSFTQCGAHSAEEKEMLKYFRRLPAGMKPVAVQTLKLWAENTGEEKRTNKN